MAIQFLNGLESLGGTITITKSTTAPLMYLYNTTNGGGAAIRFGDQTTPTQTGDITYFHQDSSSQGGGASFHFTGEPDTVLVVGSSTIGGRVVVKSQNSATEVDYGFYDDYDTGIRRINANELGLVAGGVLGLDVLTTTTRLRYAGVTKISTTSAGVSIAGSITFNGGLNSTGNLIMTTAGSSAEKMRITSAGGVSFGSTGTAYGTSGQVLTSGGDASPTWTTPTTGTVTGSGTATQVAFWDGTSSLSGDNDLYWDNTNGCLGINDTTPTSRLKVAGVASDISIYTVDISHVKTNPDVATHAMRINMDLSGADNTTADRTNSGVLVDIDSSANGDVSNEHRIRGVNADVRFSGYSDAVQGGYFLAESNYTGGKTAQLMGVQGVALHDTSATTGGVSNMYGVFGQSTIQDLGDVDNAFGGYFVVELPNQRGNANFGISKGVEGHINIDKAATVNYGEMMAVSGIIDNNEGTVPNFGNQYLFKGDYQGTKGNNAYGIYCEGDKHYFDGNVGIGTTSPTSKLTVAGQIMIAPSSGTPSIKFQDSGTTNAYIDLTDAQQRFDFRDDSDTVMSVTLDTLRVGVGTTNPKSKLQVDGGIQMAGDTDTPSADKVGTLRYYDDANNSYVDMCMKTGSTTYAWINIVQNNF